MATQRPKGQGTFRRYKTGWQWILRTKESSVTGTGKTKKEAEANGRSKLKSPLSTTSKTLAEAWKEMEPELCKALSPTNYAQYCATLKKLNWLGQATPANVKPTDITEWASLLGGSLVTLRGHVSRVRAMLNRLGHKVTIELPKPPRKEKTTVWGSESSEFMGWIENLPENRRLAVGLLYLSGLRRSEACGLRYEDLQQEGVYLRRSVTETEDAVHVRHRLKTDDSVAWVPLSPKLLQWIGSGSGFILTGTNEPMRPRSLTQLVRRTMKGSKWPDLTPQSLRRGFGQAVWETTGNSLLTASMMRHSHAMTEKEYVQVDRGIKARTHDLVFGDRAKTCSKRKAK